MSMPDPSDIARADPPPPGDGRVHTAAVTVLVWVDAWQMQCCGDPFEVGDEVAWRLEDADEEWPGSAVGPDLAGRIRYAEERHADRVDALPPRRGRVVAVTAASCAYATSPADPRTAYPVPGSTALRDVGRADEREPPGLPGQLNGWVVEVDLRDDA